MQLSLTTFVLALSVSVLGACSTASTGELAPKAGVVMSNLDGATVIAQGSFSGRNDHVVTGTVQIVEMNGKSVLRLGGGFTLDGAPDPKIGFGKAGSYDQASTVSPLVQHSGAQDYPLPAGFQLGSLDEAYIWCDKFSVALGVAQLQR